MSSERNFDFEMLLRQCRLHSEKRYCMQTNNGPFPQHDDCTASQSVTESRWVHSCRPQGSRLLLFFVMETSALENKRSCCNTSQNMDPNIIILQFG